jgi:predicted DNA-binding transcriptional regulator YafY
MAYSTHDTLVYRLSQMLIKLNAGEKLIPRELAKEFGVNLRTIQRDLNVRFAHLPICKEANAYALDPLYLGKLSEADIRRFAEIAGVHKLFPSMDTDFVLGLLRDKGQPSVVVRGHSYEDLGPKREQFKVLEGAIKEHKAIDVRYSKSGVSIKYDSLSPYRLLNSKGIWYLVAATNDGEIKSFSLTNIESIELPGKTFKPDREIQNVIENTEGVWFSKSSTEVVLRVSQEVSHYFKRRKIIDNQTIIRELENGSLHLKVAVADFKQILPIIRYWIPHLTVIAPDSLRQQLTFDLQSYLLRMSESVD